MKIQDIKAREIFDSRGNPTVECEMILEGIGYPFRGLVPSGASTGKFEALELRDGDKNRMSGKGVLKAVSNVNEILKPQLISREFLSYEEFDNFMISLDGTPNKSKFGANAILSLSLAFYKAWSYANYGAVFLSQGDSDLSIPVPMLNVINGGQHADNDVDFQEFMILPIGFSSLKEALSATHSVITNIKKDLKSQSLNTNLGDEGGFAPLIDSNEKALDLIVSAIKAAGFKNGKDVSICLDVAANELFKSKKYSIHSKKFISADQTINKYLKIKINFLWALWR